LRAGRRPIPDRVPRLLASGRIPREDTIPQYPANIDLSSSAAATASKLSGAAAATTGPFGRRGRDVNGELCRRDHRRFGTDPYSQKIETGLYVPSRCVFCVR